VAILKNYHKLQLMDGFQGQSIDQLKAGVLYNLAIGS